MTAATAIGQVRDKVVRIVVWDERQPKQKSMYEDFLGNHIADYLRKQEGFKVRSVGLDDPQQGLSEEILNNCDVLIWWGHVRQGEGGKLRFSREAAKISPYPRRTSPRGPPRNNKLE